MCYMSEREPGHVGVRELRQNLSVYLARVQGGGVADHHASMALRLHDSFR